MATGEQGQNFQRRPKSKARPTPDGELDRLITRTTQVYVSQWQTLGVMAALRGEAVADLVREALDNYIVEKGLRPKLITQLKALFQAEVSEIVGGHIRESEEKARVEIEATREALAQLADALNTLIDQVGADNAVQRRELDQVIEFLTNRKVPIKRG